MSSPKTAAAALDRLYLEIRCRLLDVGAALDRIERAEGAGAIAGDPRWKKLREGLAILSSAGNDRAERIQMLFSDPYVAGWNRRNGAQAASERHG